MKDEPRDAAKAAPDHRGTDDHLHAVHPHAAVSVVIPTRGRPGEIQGVLEALNRQTSRPREVIVVDGAEPEDLATQRVVEAARANVGFALRYVQGRGGAGVQRNIGIRMSTSHFVFLVDDDVRPASPCLERLLATLRSHRYADVACAAARVGESDCGLKSSRWKVYRAVGLMRRTSPGSYDEASGHATPRRSAEDDLFEPYFLDVVGGGCALWRAEVLKGLQFAPFFDSFFYNEDIHLSLRARAAGWRVCDVPNAVFEHRFASCGRASPKLAARHGVINRRFVFVDCVRRRSMRHDLRFWTIEVCEFALKVAASLAGRAVWAEVAGHAVGIVAAWRRWPGPRATTHPADRSSAL